MKVKNCIECNNEYKFYTYSNRKFCSHACYWKNKKGKPVTWGNKISEKLKGKVKTKEHLQKISIALRKRKDRNCKICGNVFYPVSDFNNTCSIECGIKIRTKKYKIKCLVCNIEFEGYKNRKFCSTKCNGIYSSNARLGKNNPAYRNGFAVFGSRKYTGIHLRACSKYRKVFLEKHGYLFCESCNINSNGTPKFEVHHIYYASLYPKHKELHNQKNLILLCLQCHNDFHSSKRKDEFIKIEKERGLKELFNKM